MITRVTWDDRLLPGLIEDEVARYQPLVGEGGSAVLHFADGNPMGPVGTAGELRIEATDTRACHVRARIAGVTERPRGGHEVLVEDLVDLGEATAQRRRPV